LYIVKILYKICIKIQYDIKKNMYRILQKMISYVNIKTGKYDFETHEISKNELPPEIFTR